MSWKDSTERALSVTVYGLLIIMFLSGCAAKQRTKDVNLRESEEKAAPKAVSIEEQWGIEVQGISLSAAGYMLDFRYKVVDPTKAIPILRRRTRPYLIDQATGTKIQVPTTKIGSLHQTTLKPEAGRVYFTIFANPGKLVKPGNKITVAIGDMRIENLEVN
jgi:hypothetical protein